MAGKKKQTGTLKKGTLDALGPTAASKVAAVSFAISTILVMIVWLGLLCWGAVALVKWLVV